MVLYNEFLKRVGLEAKVARIRKGYSVQQLAKQTGLSDAAINRLELGRSDFKALTIKRISDALEVPIIEFFVTLPNEKR